MSGDAATGPGPELERAPDARTDVAPARDGLAVVAILLEEWSATRAALAEMERAGHPDIVDRHGRVWTWKPGGTETYRHCGSAIPREWIDDLIGLRPASLAENPNYYPLCDICTSEWTDADRARAAEVYQRHHEQWPDLFPALPASQA